MDVRGREEETLNNIMRSCFLSIWTIIDPIYYFFTRLTYVENASKEKSIFRVRLTTYKGCDFTLSDGTLIQKNDKLIKIHLHNAKLLKELSEINCDIKRGRYVYQKVKESLPFLAMYMDGHPRKNELKGIIGITSLHRGCNRLGFETCEIKSRIYRKIKQSSFLLIFLISSSNFLIHKKEPRYLFMSTNTLTNQYLRKVN